ncbi:MAG: hypothetical protein II532_00030 [Bacteroidales bacterium]|nr:hypothetical protein [Bacteroidales bacterium]
MRKRRFLWMILCSVMLFAGCEPEVSFDADLLVGKWQMGTEYWKYNSDFSGATWDVADDVSEEEAQPFTWTLEDDQLTQLHQMEMGGVVPKVYTVTTLNTTTLTYKDNYSQTFTFKRIS